MESYVLVFCAHSDDEAVGMGGTIARYIKEGKKVVKIIFSYGEKSHPQLYEFFVAKERVKETMDASNSMGIKHTTFMGLSDLALKEADYDVIHKVRKLINEFKPSKIFCTSKNDPHPDHRAAFKIVTKALQGFTQKYEFYTYEVWNVIDENLPAFYVDISPFYHKKIEYMKKFKSQWIYMYFFVPVVYLRCRRYGKTIGKRFAEKFYKLQ